MKRIAVLTSGGDAPGMNAALRAVVRCGVAKGWTVLGVRDGFRGLMNGEFQPMGNRDVGEIIQRGGTILGSARCPEFKTLEGRKAALEQIRSDQIESVIVIGGNGSQTGALELDRLGVPVIGLASTIDNDFSALDQSLGVDTALNIALEAIDRLKVTASSHKRVFAVEVMGRKCGYLALMAGLAGGAEAIVVPEVECNPEEIAREITEAYDRGKPRALVVVAEGAQYNAEGLARYFREHHERLGFELRVTILGHVQRGGAPTAFDRLLGSQLGYEAIERLDRGEHGLVLGWRLGRVTAVPFSEALNGYRTPEAQLIEIAHILHR